MQHIHKSTGEEVQLTFSPLFPGKPGKPWVPMTPCRSQIKSSCIVIKQFPFVSHWVNICTEVMKAMTKGLNG